MSPRSFTIAFDEPDEQGWIVARVLEVSGAVSQGRTREEARDNALDAAHTVLAAGEEVAGQRSGYDGDGKHAKWRGPHNQVCAVPRHDKIGPGLVRAICDELGIPQPDEQH